MVVGMFKGWAIPHVQPLPRSGSASVMPPLSLSVCVGVGVSIAIGRDKGGVGVASLSGVCKVGGGSELGTTADRLPDLPEDCEC